jgi:RES domain-containing protein
MVLWRISNDATLDGRGGLYASARWHTQGRPIVYLAGSPAGALVEVIVHLEIRDGLFPKTFQLLKLQVPDEVSRELLDASALRSDWVEDTRVSRAVGDRWMEESRSALFEVPSAIVPETTNWIFNPAHPDARRITIDWHKPFPADGRLFRPRK